LNLRHHWLRWVALGVVLLTIGIWSQAAEPENQQATQETQQPKQDQSKPATEAPAGRFTQEVKVVAPPIVEGDRVTPFATQVSSVSDRQVDDLNAGDLANALRRMPGVTISRYDLVGSYGGGDGGAVYVRGQGSGRPGAEINTMIDGIPRFVGVWTHPLLDVLSTDMADRIDVYKSAQPVLFGNMAFAGVNLGPKTVAHEGMATRVMGSYGDYATAAGLVENGAKLGDLDYYVMASQRQSDGHRENADGRVRTLYGRLGYEVAAGWNLNVQVHSNDAWADDPGQVGAPPTDVVPRFGVKDTLSIATLSEEHGNHTGSLKVYSDSGSIDWLQWDAAKSQSFTTLTDFSSCGLHLQETFRLEGRTELVAGYDHDTYGGSSTEQHSTYSSVFPELMLHNNGAYAMVAKTFGDTTLITPSLGVRYTGSSDFGGNWGGQAGLVVKRGNTELHANFARAFNLPGVYAAAMYSQWHRGDTWKDLEAERLDHWELGVSQQLSGATRLQLTVFDDHVTNALRFVPPPPPPPVFANIGDYTIRGAEASVSVAPSQSIAVFGGVTYLDPNPTDVPNAPKWSLVSGLSWLPVERVRLNVDAEWVDTQAVLNPRFSSTQTWIDNYFLVNLKAGYQLSLGSSARAELYVAGENLTGSEYEYRPGYPAPGRVLSGGLELRF